MKKVQGGRAEELTVYGWNTKVSAPFAQLALLLFLPPLCCDMTVITGFPLLYVVTVYTECPSSVL